ncbi:Detected protein of confused Function [Hibiscus syriacus]|uniref:Detected protein of confused Function n=1 Tax=Hibiscus syriacus TaxID=106335 RepID=A0A6A3A5Y9_HIBSY|nr:Detected protein of confused Function [Hibiscus syriacus]
MKENEKGVLSVMRRSNVATLVELLTATSPRIREKAVTVICSLAESGSCESWLVSEGFLPPLIRLVESGSTVGKEKAIISLQRLSSTIETARAIVEHGGVRPLIETCRSGGSVSQAAAASTLKNISAVPQVRQLLTGEGIIKVMINLLDCGVLLGSKEYAAECLQNLTANNENMRRSVFSEGGIRSLLAYLDSPLPQESAVRALKNLVGSVSIEVLMSLGFLPRLALSSLATVSQNCRELKKNDKSVPNLVQLLDPSPQNTAKKYAVPCLASLSSSKTCKKLMISYGAIGYLKKLSEMDIPGAKKLLERLERRKNRCLFNRK